MSALPAAFSVDVRPARDRVVVAPQGELDLATVEGVRAEIAELRSRGFSDVVLDLRGLTFLDSAGIHLLLDSHRAAEARGLAFSIIDGPEPVGRALELTGVSHVLRRAPRAVRRVA